MDQNIHFPSISPGELQKVHTKGIAYKKLGNKILSSFHLYTQLNSKIPDITIMQDIDHKKLFIKLTEHYKLNPLNVLSSEEYDENTGEMVLKRWMIFLKKDLLIAYSEEGVNLLYDNETPEEEAHDWTNLLKLLVKTPEEEMKDEGRMNILGQDMFGNMSLKSFTVPKPVLDIDLHYNDDFRPVHEYILKRLQTPDDTGLVLLHGLPGTGKTTYLRYLSFILNKKLIYVPPAIASNLSSVNFVTFMIDYPNSILIIEDAENILVDDGIRTFQVSSLLNVADGLLSDCLNLQVICTFNTDLRRIDKALLRKGRLIALYEFKKLITGKAQILAKSLGMKEMPESPATLADIFNMSDPGYKFEKKNKIGFNREP
jgi:hypothetical protein